MDVVVIGYGKIGAIKAGIWQRLGRRVIVYEPDASKHPHILLLGYKLYTPGLALAPDLIADISTPASMHIASLRHVVARLNPLPRVVIIEKPLASSLCELQQFEMFLDTDVGKALRDRITIDESYYLSDAVRAVAAAIRRDQAEVRRVYIELSKNRLPDVQNGRFIDSYLGPFGIELPHMLAIARMLGLDLAAPHQRTVTQFQHATSPYNSGLRVDIIHGTTAITLCSFLGDFRVAEGITTRNFASRRVLEVETDAWATYVELDPVADLERYVTRIATTNKATGTGTVRTLEDNHLKNLLHLVHSGDLTSAVMRDTGADASIALTKYLFALSSAKRTSYIDTVALMSSDSASA